MWDIIHAPAPVCRYNHIFGSLSASHLLTVVCTVLMIKCRCLYGSVQKVLTWPSVSVPILELLFKLYVWSNCCFSTTKIWEPDSLQIWATQFLFVKRTLRLWECASVTAIVQLGGSDW